MVRSVAAMIALAGCDLVVGAHHLDPIAALCGPYGVPERVMFDPALGAPTDLSVATDGVHGLVYATYNNTTGPTPVVFDGTQWQPDTARFSSGTLATQLSGGHIDVTGNVTFGWIDHRRVTPPLIVEYGYTTAWSVVSSDVADVQGYDLFTGQEVESDDGFGAQSRYVVEIFEPITTVTPHKIEILAAVPPKMDLFKPSGFVTPLNADTSIDVTGGALTADHKILVYAASQHDMNEPHLYETAFGHNEFDVGNPVSSLLLSGKADDQPWVNADCTTIWFRRDGVTWRAHKL